MNFYTDVSDSLSFDELKKIIESNILEGNSIRKKIKKLDELNMPVTFEEKKLKEPFIEIKHDEDSFDLSEYEYYYENIKNVPIGSNLEELKKVIRDNLPSKNNSNYFNIILYIKYKIDEEILTYASLIEQCDSVNDISILNDVKVCIEYLKIKLSLIDKIDYEVKNKDDRLEYNNIIFLHSKVGNNYPISDLEAISEDYYECINELYESIKNNIFKGVKRFKNNDGNICGVSEVRSNSVRIIFDRLNENTYIILQVFIKKTNKDYGYKNSISSRYSKYNKKDVLDKLNDESFIIETENEIKQFEKILAKRSKVKKLC